MLRLWKKRVAKMLSQPSFGEGQCDQGKFLSKSEISILGNISLNLLWRNLVKALKFSFQRCTSPLCEAF